MGSSRTTATTLAMPVKSRSSPILGRGGLASLWWDMVLWVWEDQSARFDSCVVPDLVSRLEGEWSAVCVEWNSGAAAASLSGGVTW